jgi:O-antigen ligase
MVRLLLDLPSWFFCALIVLTPWAFGGIPLWVETPWAKLMLIVVGLYFLIRLIRRKWGRPPWILVAASLLILLQGWFMTINSRFQYVQHRNGYVTLQQPAPNLPGSLNRKDSLQNMWKISALLAATWMACALAHEKVWRRRLLNVLIFAGTALAGFGLFMKLQSPSSVFPDIDRNTFPFATFFYHGNAAAYMNTILPIALVFFLRTLVVKSGPWKRASYVCASLLLVTGALVCGSKVGLILSLFLILAAAGCFLILFKGRWSTESFHLPAYFLWPFLVGAIGLVVYLIGRETIFTRWQYAWEAGQQIMAGRAHTAGICLKSLPEAGWFGFGPGTFSTVFPFAAKQQKAVLDGFWIHAHQDYLQTVMEWGRVGALLWATLFFGAIVRYLTSLTFWRRVHRPERLVIMGVLLTLCGVALHSFVDFPLQITAIQFNIAVVIGLLWAPIKLMGRRSTVRAS